MSGGGGGDGYITLFLCTPYTHADVVLDYKLIHFSIQTFLFTLIKVGFVTSSRIYSLTMK